MIDKAHEIIYAKKDSNGISSLFMFPILLATGAISKAIPWTKAPLKNKVSDGKAEMMVFG